ncbi:MAG TPA: CaiB/BaiF CoA-transferase family protein [Bryobacteraceae bacterium]|nr:CaiB/BaiF CoA-transferase family protein [Bryobacteraceae bacterium]
MRPLDGVLVLDLSRLLPGNAASLMLANFGAEVIKIEQPGVGDYGRSMPPFLHGEGAVFGLLNRGKKSVALDLKDASGKEALLDLAARADVLIESFRPGVMARLGLGFDVLSARNERLIYAAITGYGQQGSRSRMAGHDINYQALAGILEITGEPGGAPVVPGVQIADLAGGAMQAVIGVLLALAARTRTGRGQMVDVSMLDGAAWMLPVALAAYQATGALPDRGAAVLTGRYACYRLYRCADGRWISVGALEPKFWSALCQALGCDDLIPEQFAEGERRIEIITLLSRIFETRTAAEWTLALTPHDACVAPVQNVAEAMQEFGLGVAETVVIPKLSATPGHLGGPAPRLGEQTHEILSPRDR